MSIFPKWLKEFPQSFIETYKQAIPENWAEFKEEVSSGAKAVLSVPAKVVSEVIKPLNKPLIIIGVLLIVVLIFWKKLSKLVGI